MLVAILGDTHFGMRNDSVHFHELYRKFYTETFFPYLKQNNINIVFQLGDLFDRRKYINFNTLSLSRKYFFDILKENNITLITLLGNHDLYWKNSLSVSSSDLLLKDYENIQIVNSPTNFNFNDYSVDIVPWICDENHDATIDFINQSKNEICMGHFEISGFSMYKGMPSHDGLDKNIFQKYELVLSGHYHHKSEQNNILYVGSPGEMTWQDFDDLRGFHVLNLSDRSILFIENPFKIFKKIYYDDKTNDISKITNIDMSDYSDCYVKIIVVNKTNPYLFDVFLNNLYNVNPIDIAIIEDFIESNEEQNDQEIDQAEDTITILNKYIDNLNDDNLDSSKLKNILKELYIEAINLDNI